MSKQPPITNQLEIGRWIMACRFEVLLNAGLPAAGADIAMQALDIAEHLELLFSVYKPESDFSRINAAPPQVPVEVSDETIELVTIALQLRQKTAGAFDLTAAALSDLWGFSRRAGRMPSTNAISQAVETIANHTITIDRDRKSITRNSNQLRVNSGGIGKGYALDRMADFLRANQIDNFLVHGGHSSILACGNRFDRDRHVGWAIALRHPENMAMILGEICLQDQALGTSGPANQFFYYDGVRYSHVIDPRTGWPASGMLSLTVLHPNAGFADALATGLFVIGLDRAVEYCAKHPETSFLAVLPTTRQGDVEVVTCNLRPNTWQKAQ